MNWNGWQKGEGGTPRLCEALGGMIRVTTQSERMMKSKTTTHAERAISRQSDCFGKKFGFCSGDTALDFVGEKRAKKFIVLPGRESCLPAGR